MNVFHVLDHSIPLHSGYSFRSRSIIRAQRELGINSVVLTSAKQGSARDETEELEGVRYHRLASPAGDLVGGIPFVRELRLMLRMWQRIERIARREKSDLIHSHSPLLNGLPALWVARRLKIPFIYEARAFWEDAAVDHGTFAENSFRYRISQALETFLFKHTDHAVTICEAMRQDLKTRGISIENVTVIPNGVDIDEFQPRVRANALAKDLGLNGGPVFGFIGSFYRYEGLRFLIESFPKLRARIPDACLLLVGGGEEEEVLKELAREKSGVHFTGRVPHQHISEFYSLVDIFVCPRLRMRLTDLVTPLKPLESMAMGKAVLASDVGGHKELIDDGRTGCLFAAESVDDLVSQSVRLANDSALRAKLGDAGRKFVAEERSWKNLCRRYLQLYDAALNDKPN
jgi:PEP-CTERM/exosortase A-associated glycosyltransferase